MLDALQFIAKIKSYGVSLFTGVPDSLLHPFCAALGAPPMHITAANEGNAIGLGMGHYLSTGKPAVVYMQNSGLGNCVNPLTSLADQEVYAIPILLVIGWRGEPGCKDEPQHCKQGRITTSLLEVLEIPYQIVDAQSDIDNSIAWAFECMKANSAPVALLVRKGTFKPNSFATTTNNLPLSREDAIATILECSSPFDIFVATTGKAGRELNELRLQRGEPQRDFLTVGGMGHTSSIALGIALSKPHRRIICLDGDGSLLMHLGASVVAGSLSPKNLVHIILNNHAHESVGGQPVLASHVDMASLMKACGYSKYIQAADKDSIHHFFECKKPHLGPICLDVQINLCSRNDLGRPKSTPQENKHAFIKHLAGDIAS